MSSSGSSNAFKAFVDASAGAMGALFAAVLLYPLDVAKTRQQVDVHENSKSSDSPDERAAHEAVQRRHPQRNMWMICWMLYQSEGMGGLFAGLSSKVVHTVFSNFAYFYWYSFLKQAVERHYKQTISTGMNLLVASLAGALNMSMTLPLEMINTRAQIKQSDEEEDSESGEEDTKVAGAIQNKKTTKTTSTQHKSMVQIVKEIYEEDGILSFWRGYIPALVLVSNPSINYTVFDKLKLRLQHYKLASSSTAKRLSSLSMWEAFVLGAIAKAIATILTYPIIRAKVLMQAQKKAIEHKPNSTTQHDTTKHHHHPEMGNSMIQVLRRIGELEGPTGYFKGCSAQLFNTVLKSALLLMTKEQITKYTMRFLYALRRGPRDAPVKALQ